MAETNCADCHWEGSKSAPCCWCVRQRSELNADYYFPQGVADTEIIRKAVEYIAEKHLQTDDTPPEGWEAGK